MEKKVRERYVTKDGKGACIQCTEKAKEAGLLQNPFKCLGFTVSYQARLDRRYLKHSYVDYCSMSWKAHKREGKKVHLIYIGRDKNKAEEKIMKYVEKYNLHHLIPSSDDKNSEKIV